MRLIENAVQSDMTQSVSHSYCKDCTMCREMGMFVSLSGKELHTVALTFDFNKSTKPYRPSFVEQIRGRKL